MDVFIVATSNKHVDVVSCCVPIVDPLERKANYSATSNNVKLVHWPLIGGLLHLVQRGGACAGCVKCNIPPINGQCTNHCIAIGNGPLLCGFNVAIKGLMAYNNC